ncbi:capsular polysaccharide biosynthesis protein [Aquimarina addita]|uniref:protein-tyrosine-phosphatase n=1 Tax=Aquimarina addita TaxID=870485 RepID=A0ABP7XFN3_9FLAO
MLFSKKQVPFKDIIPDGYVDIHSHLLANIDDGVKTVYQSAYIIEQLKNIGVKKIITTPHVMQEIWPNTSETIITKRAEICEILKSLNITIAFEASAEYMLDDLFYKRLKEKDIIPLSGNHLLVEMSTFAAPINLNELLFEMKLAQYIPIIAHPERYSFYHNQMHKYDELKERGVLFQLNLLSLSGFYGERVKEVAIKLLNGNYFDFSGSDIHNYRQLEVLQKGFPAKYAKKITQLMEKNAVFSE